MAERRISRKELLKEPDEFMTTTGQIIRYFRDNPKIVTILIILIAAIVLSAFGFFTYKKQQQSRSHELFESASKDYENLMMSRQQVTPQQLDALFERFDSIAKEYPSYLEGEMALLYSGHVMYQKNDYAGALERYTKLQTSDLSKKGFESLIMYHVAATRFALKQYEEAKKLFDHLTKDTNSPYRREAYAYVARIYEAQKKNKEAVQAYKQYLKAFPEAPDAAVVKARITDLSGDT